VGAISSSIGTRGGVQEKVLREIAENQGIPDDLEEGGRGYSDEGRRDSSEEPISEGFGRERRNLTEQRQSSEYSDNQGGNSRSAVSKSEGQLLEDVKAGGPMLTSALISHSGRPVLAGHNNDDPLVYPQIEDELRRERSFRPSHDDDGGGDASQVELQPRDKELIEALILEGQARDLGRTPRFQSQ
jgi:hypothetical protein